MNVFYANVPALLLIVTASIGLFTLIILGFVVYIRTKTEQQTRREKVWMEKWRASLAATLVAGSPPESLSVSRWQMPSFIMAWNRFMEDITGGSEASLIDLGYRLKINKWAQRKLRSGSLFERGLAIVTLGNLGDRNQWEKIARIAQDDGSVLGYLACRALIRIDAPQAAPLVIPVLIQRHTWPAEWRAVLLKETGAENIEPFKLKKCRQNSCPVLLILSPYSRNPGL